MAEHLRDGTHGSLVVARQQHDAQAVALELLHGLPGLGLQRVGDAENADRHVVHRDEDRGLAEFPQALGLGLERADVHARVGHQPGVAHGDPAHLHDARRSRTGHRLETVGATQSQPSLVCAARTIAAASGCSLACSRLAA